VNRFLIAPLLALALIGPAQAASPAIVQVTMTSFRFAPSALQLAAGTPVILRLRNNSGGGHNFAAPAFFAAARIAPASAGLVHDGRVEVKSHSVVDVALTPAAGQYPVKCTHTLHSAFGMKGNIVVR
jgi:plastocyanin